jgi:hypothetical protein
MEDDYSWMHSMSSADQILPGLFLGPLEACEPTNLQLNGITHIVRIISGYHTMPPSHVCMKGPWEGHRAVLRDFATAM